MTASAFRPLGLHLAAIARTAALVLSAAACGTSGPASGSTSGPASGGVESPGVPVVRSASDPMSADLFPLAGSTSRFVLAGGEGRTVRVEPSSDASAVVRIEGTGTPTRIDVARTGASYVFSAGPDSSVELIRVGAVPGATWESGEWAVGFAGWERVVVPAGTYDAARVTTSTGPETLRVVQTWWFAPGTGIVRLRSDRGGIFTEEMSLAATE